MINSIKGQMPDTAINDLLLLAKRPAFKKLLYVPVINWVLVCSCLVSLLAWFYLANQWLAGELSAVWLTMLSTYTFFIFILTVHEASHLVIARNRWLNDVIGTLLTFIPYPQLPVLQFRHQHLTHHRDTCGEEDPDDYLYQGRWLTRVFKVFSHDFYWCLWSYKNRKSASTATQIANITGFVVYVSILVLGFSSVYWYEFLMVYFIPQRIGFAVAIYMFAYVQHPPEKCSVKEDSPFKTTAVIRGFDTAFAKVYFGQNRHLIHHLYPNMPIYRNWQAWQLGKDIFEQQDLVNIGLNVESFEKTNFATTVSTGDNNSHLLMATIAEIVPVAKGINCYTFIPAKTGDDFPGFNAGAHIDIEVKPGVVRQYSLCNSSEDKNKYVIAVQCEEQGRGGSKLLHESFTVGRTVKISKPRNLFALKPGNDILLFAGGIGITPMLAMAWTLHHKNIPFELHYCIANEDKWAFKAEWPQLPFLSSLFVHLDDGREEQKLDAVNLLCAHSDADIYVCGPCGFIGYIESSANKAGLKAKQVNKESFAAGGHTANKPNKEFKLIVSGIDKEFIVAKDKTIVQVLQDNNIFIPISCENGVCGTCKCTVKSGDVEHRDLVLNDHEQQQQRLFTPCVSRASTDTLEITL